MFIAIIIINYHVNYECISLKGHMTQTSVNALWTVKSHNAYRTIQ